MFGNEWGAVWVSLLDLQVTYPLGFVIDVVRVSLWGEHFSLVSGSLLYIGFDSRDKWPFAFDILWLRLLLAL